MLYAHDDCTTRVAGQYLCQQFHLHRMHNRPLDMSNIQVEGDLLFQIQGLGTSTETL